MRHEDCSGSVGPLNVEPSSSYSGVIGDDGFVEKLVEGFGAAELKAAELLRRLIGRPLETASGSPNCIVEVVDGSAIVQTVRSPGGQPVPIQWVQSALETLLADGEVVIHPESVGYRSAFIGAVLRTLPGATIGGSPPTVRLDRAAFITGTP